MTEQTKLNGYANGTANGVYSVLLTVRPGTATTFVDDVAKVAKGEKPSTTFGKIFVRAKLGEIRVAPPSGGVPAQHHHVADAKVVVTTRDPDRVRRALFFQPRKATYKNIGVQALQIHPGA
jgi:hypothetical protein